MPVLVDTMTDQVGHLYSGMPSRLYVIDPAGRITYKAGRGPYGLRPGEMEQALILTLQASPPQPPPDPSRMTSCQVRLRGYAGSRGDP